MPEVTKYGYLATQEFPFRRERVNQIFKSNKNSMHKRATTSTKYKVPKTVKEQELIEQMKYIEAKINKLMIDQNELDKKQSKINR